MRALITGATGTIGRKLVGELGKDTVVLSRSPERASRELGVRAVGWNGHAPVELDGADAVFHLAGEPVADGRWTANKRRQIRESRVDGTRALVASIARARTRPRVLVSASAVGFYGSRGDELLTEASPPGQGFLAEVCQAWEDEATSAESLGVRVVCLRIGVVLARDGGALARMLPIFRTGLAGKLGSGEQWMPWIHVDDVVGLLRHAARNDAVRGPLNAVSPELVTNATFTKTLARVVHRPAIFAAPRRLLELVLGETAGVVLASQRVVPDKALATGYRFKHRSLAPALEDLLAPPAVPRASPTSEVHP